MSRPPWVDQFRESLDNGGVKPIIVAPQLFPTPPDLAAQVVDMACIRPTDRILEPSAGTGALLDWLPDPEGTLSFDVVAVELNVELCEALNGKFNYHAPPLAVKIVQGDFLELTPRDLLRSTKFDRVIMNPPFVNGADIKHIRHAQTFLRVGGVLVSICANGPRQQREFRDAAGTVAWIPLPPGSFKASGTDVNAAIVVMGAR